NPRVRNDPLEAVQRERLLFPVACISCLQEGVAKTDISLQPCRLRIRTAETHESRHRLEKFPIDWFAVEVNNTDNAAHFDPPADIGSPGPVSIKPCFSKSPTNRSRSCRRRSGGTSYS